MPPSSIGCNPSVLITPLLAEEFYANQDSPLGSAEMLYKTMAETHLDADMLPFESSRQKPLNSGPLRVEK